VTRAALPGKQRWLVPEVVQTSAMDCGPATLKCLLEGFNIPVSYGRLREACQTDVDGTSIDTLEDIATQLGVPVEQISIPLDHVFLPQSAPLPAIIVTRHRDGAAHFVVAWRRHGAWLQLMDPSIGRRWVRCQKFAEEIYQHTQGVTAREWREWAGTADSLEPLRERLAALGADENDARSLIGNALADAGWFRMGALDASVRLVQSVITAGGVRAGAQAVKLLTALFRRTCDSVTGKGANGSSGASDDSVDVYALIPPHYWSVTPDPETVDHNDPKLQLHGAVLLRVMAPPQTGVSKHAGDAPVAMSAVAPAPVSARPLSVELAAALNEKPAHPLNTIWELLRMDGLLAPLALIGAMAIAAGAILVEMLLFRGLFDMAGLLTQPLQRLGAAAALITFALILLVIQVPIVLETARMSRHLEVRLRMTLLRKLPRLTDRYFHSRPVSDMAERSHSIQMARHVPAMGLQFVQVLCELALTLAGIVLIDASAAWGALAIAVFAIVLSAAAQPMINERDLQVRNHAGALYGFYLDALLGLTPIRTHAAEKAVSRQHEGLLVTWARASRGLYQMSLLTGGVQSLVCMGIAGYVLVDHFLRAGGVTGGDLLLVYWVLKLPAIGGTISALAHAYPAQRNALLRLLEPLSAPEEAAALNEKDLKIVKNRKDDASGESVNQPDDAFQEGSVDIHLTGGRVLAAGHTILQDLDLTIAPGEHVAIVGKSGAGKSSLIGLLLGWHRLAQGTLKVGGEPLAGAALEQLRRHTAWVDPGIQVWNRSFMENVAYATHTGADAAAHEGECLARMGGVVESAHLRGVLQKLPQGLQTYLGEGGALLSGGEGQRVRLARAFLQTDVRLALLDEPFRGMDRGQRGLLLADARQWWKDVTLLCVTHDVGETQGFDRVLVIEDGRIVEDGAPSALASRASRYRELLDTEQRVRDNLWQGAQWRRLQLREGRLVQQEAGALHHGSGVTI
jgi:ABC-type bacteriocin/lantibiotic exporter with double-glycine peptidase domain